jgi:FlaA1/EpsC-like NDP-sugar epimerase
LPTANDARRLLGRAPRQLDATRSRAWLEGQSVLVTGAGGSIGAALCRHCALGGVRRLVLVDIDELALLHGAALVREVCPMLECEIVLGDCGDPAVMTHALRRGAVETVIHAAAYKHLPLLETQLREAMRNNVLATATVARCSSAAGVGCVVLVSTDKAVQPVSVLGASKRMAERMAAALLTETPVRLVTVRFGNVLGSAGSVVHVFREQIRRGGPVTVTDPDATRYFMTIDEACQLILEAAALQESGGLYALDMGPPVSILALAREMIRLEGPAAGRPVSIDIVGLRPGERRHEPAFPSEARIRPTSCPGILRLDEDDAPLPAIGALLQRLEQAVTTYDLAALQRLLQEMVPEYRPAVDGMPMTYDQGGEV